MPQNKMESSVEFETWDVTPHDFQHLDGFPVGILSGTLSTNPGSWLEVLAETFRIISHCPSKDAFGLAKSHLYQLTQRIV